MISRRDALKLGAAGLAAPSLVIPGRERWHDHLYAQESIGSTPVAVANATPAPVAASAQVGPRQDQPIVVRWRSEWLGQSFDPPVVAGGFVYSGSQALVKLDARTGETVWEFSPTNEQTSQPAMADGLVFVSSIDRTGGSVQAVDDTSGTEVWRFAPQDAVPMQPSVVDDVVVVGVSDRSIRALDVASGEERWRLPMLITFDFQPIAANGMVFASDEAGTVSGIDALSGQEAWRFSAGGVVGSQAISAGNLLLGTENGTLFSIDAMTGEERWRQTPNVEDLRTISTGDTMTCVDAGPELLAFDTATDAPLWRYSSGVDNAYTSHAVAGNVVYLSGDHLYAIDAPSGQELWRYALDRTNMTAFPYFTVADGVIYIRDSVDSRSHLFAFGNLPPAVLVETVPLRAAPSSSALERGTVEAGTEIDFTDGRESRDGVEWMKVEIDGIPGWIPLDAIDPASLPPEGGIEYVYIPE